MRLSRKRGIHNRHLQETKIWVQILGRRNVQHLPAIVFIGADQNDKREDINRELLKRINEKGHRVKENNFEIQFRGIRFPEQMR